MPTHWKKLTNPNYLGAYSFNKSEEKHLTIKNISVENIKNVDGKEERCTVMHFVENEKAMILNKTNCKTIAKLYKTPYIEDWSNRQVTIYVEKVKAFGELVEGLRIKAKIPPTSNNRQIQELKCVDCGGEIIGINGTAAEQIAHYTSTKYGKCLCGNCAAEIANHSEPNDVLLENTQL